MKTKGNYEVQSPTLKNEIEKQNQFKKKTKKKYRSQPELIFQTHDPDHKIMNTS